MPVRRQPTTLQLARMIADAVLRAKPRRANATPFDDPATQAVIHVLHREGCWFMAEDDQDVDGMPIAASARRLRF